jgi:hypothetical protein
MAKARRLHTPAAADEASSFAAGFRAAVASHVATLSAEGGAS